METTTRRSASKPPFSAWHLSQCFGSDQSSSDEPNQADVVSSCCFNREGTHLAAGDHGGRIVVWEKTNNPRPRTRGFAPQIEFSFLCEFQSHEQEFDCLRSAEISEKIKKISWLNRPSQSKFLLSANDKTIKLWKIYQKEIKALEEGQEYNGIQIPKLLPLQTETITKPKAIYANAHPQFPIHSVSPSSDGETFISVDTARVLMWNLNNPSQATEIVHLSAEETEEEIRAAVFHPNHCSQFAFGTDCGFVNICDLRKRLNCNSPAHYFKYEEPSRTIFTDILSSVSDIKWCPTNDRQLLVRDFMTLKIWDLSMTKEPVKIIKIHDHLRGSLAKLFEDEILFDKFDCDYSSDGRNVITGSYPNTFHIWNLDHDSHQSFEAAAHRRKKKGSATSSTVVPEQPNEINYSKKGRNLAWHPQYDAVALCTTGNLFIYSGERETEEDIEMLSPKSAQSSIQSSSITLESSDAFPNATQQKRSTIVPVAAYFDSEDLPELKLSPEISSDIGMSLERLSSAASSSSDTEMEFREHRRDVTP